MGILYRVSDPPLSGLLPGKSSKSGLKVKKGALRRKIIVTQIAKPASGLQRIYQLTYDKTFLYNYTLAFELC